MAFSLAGRLPAEILELPAELPLGVDSRLLLELGNADVYLTSHAAGLPTLRARLVAEGEQASLEAISSGGSLTVRRADAEGDGEVPRLRLDVALGPGRKVRIAGSGLMVRAKDTLPDGAGRNSVRLEVESSTAQLSGVRVSEIEATASSVRLTGTEGALVATLTGGSMQLQGHHGDLELTASEADVVVVDHLGKIMPRLDGGSMEVTGGEGSFIGTASAAHLAFAGWHGGVELHARDTSLDARESEFGDRWQIEGSELELVLERISGTIVANLEGGSLSGEELNATLELTALAGARLELVGIHGSLWVELSDQAEGWFNRVKGTFDAQVSDSRLEADEIDQLTLVGDRADVSVRQIAEQAEVELTESELDLDLRGIRRRPSLDLKGVGYARVQLQEPCIVQLAGEAASLDTAINVTSCQLQTQGEVPTDARERPRGGVRSTTLTVKMSPEAVLEVEGVP